MAEMKYELLLSVFMEKFYLFHALKRASKIIIVTDETTDIHLSLKADQAQSSSSCEILVDDPKFVN